MTFVKASEYENRHGFRPALTELRCNEKKPFTPSLMLRRRTHLRRPTKDGSKTKKL